MGKGVVHICNGLLVIKMNELESVELRWMNLEPVIWGEISQRKNKCCILMHTYGI